MRKIFFYFLKKFITFVGRKSLGQIHSQSRLFSYLHYMYKKIIVNTKKSRSKNLDLSYYIAYIFYFPAG